MKQKKSFLNLDISFFLSLGFVALIFVFIPIGVLAQTVAGSSCVVGQPNSCGTNTGLACSGVTKQCGPGCTTSNDCIVSGQYCDTTGAGGGACITGTDPNKAVTSPTAPASSPSGSRGPCPEGLGPQPVNGLCLPPNPYSTGVASQKTLTGLLILVIQFLLDFAGVVAVIVLVVGGFWYITSAGNEEQAEKGKSAIINAIIGLLVVILSYAIVTIISGTLTTTSFLAH